MASQVRERTENHIKTCDNLFDNTQGGQDTAYNSVRLLSFELLDKLEEKKKTEKPDLLSKVGFCASAILLGVAYPTHFWWFALEAWVVLWVTFIRWERILRGVWDEG